MPCYFVEVIYSKGASCAIIWSWIGSVPNGAVERFRLGREVLEETDYLTQCISPELAPSKIWTANVDDPYVSSFPEELLREVREFEAKTDALARQRRLVGHWERSPETAYVAESLIKRKGAGIWGDPVSASFYLETIASPASLAWKELIPSAFALEYLSDPFGFEQIRDFEGKVSSKDICRLHFALCIDAIGIGSRASVMASVVKQLLHKLGAARPYAEDVIHWMSIACGTALPALKAAKQLEANVNMLLVDIDDSALSRAIELASEIGFTGLIKKRSD